MKTLLRKSQHSDIPFLKEMLFEAVFWRDRDNRPTFEEGLVDPGVSKSLVDFGERDGDMGVVAIVDSIPVGAAWYRFWTDDIFIRGHIEETTPTLVIAVHSDYQHQGFGKAMINWLIDQASKLSIEKISLMVSKDNHAINLYRQCGFQKYADRGDSLLMVRNT